MIDIDSLNQHRLNDGKTVPAIGRLRHINQGSITVDVQGFYDEERYLIRLSPTCQKSDPRCRGDVFALRPSC